MAEHTFVDCQGLAGAWTLGTVQAGFKLQHRVSQPGGFGDPVIEANDALLDSAEVTLQDAPAYDWEPVKGVGYVCGTPPCSGFSVYNTSKKDNFRGADSPINSCMKDLALYGARCTGEDGYKGAEIIAFESVQGAFNSGRVLMQQLRHMIEQETGYAYELTHVKMSGASIGAAQYRHRYYFVAHRIPFGLARPEPRKVTTARDAIGDLGDLKLQIAEQPYVRGAYPNVYPDGWAPARRDDGLVDWHQTREPEHRTRRLIELLADEWRPGEYCQDVVHRLPERREQIEDLFPGRWNEEEGSLKGLPRHWPKRVRPDSPTGVVTGNSSLSFVHYAEPRPLTVRELSRLMGYPDAWRWPDGISVDRASSLVGKCCPVGSGRWISEAAREALDDRELDAPAFVRGWHREEIGDREWLHDSSLDYRRWDAEISGWSLDRRVLVEAAA